jgi:hypothetical protein
MLNPNESPLEKLLISEACEVWNYAGCAAQESNPRIKAIWERFLDYELGHLQVAIALFKDVERRDPAEVLGAGNLPRFIDFKSQRGFVRKVVDTEVPLRKDATAFVDQAEEGTTSLAYREIVNATGSPSMAASAGWVWTPGSELAQGVGQRAQVV